MKNIIFITIIIATYVQTYFPTDLLSNNQSTQKECKVARSTQYPILISNTCKSFDIDKFMDKVVWKYQETKAENAFITEGHYREKSTVNGEYQMYTEGLGYLVSLGHDFIIPRDNLSFLLKNVKKSNRKEDWLALMKYLYKDTPVTNQTDFTPGYNSLFSCFRRFEIKGPLSKNSELEYVFEKEKEIIKSEKIIYKIDFKPLEIISSEQKYYEGSLYVDTKTNQILKIVMHTAPFYSEPFRKWIKNGSLIIDYIYQNNQCYFTRLRSSYEISNVSHSIELNVVNGNIYNLILSEKDKDSFFNYDINPLVKYNKKEWDTYSFTKEKNINNIKKDLEKNISLEEQYIDNSGKPFYMSTFPGHKQFDKDMNNIYKYVEIKIEEYERKYNFSFRKKE